MKFETQLLEFDAADIETTFAKMSSGEIDTLRFGVIQLDAAGTILRYNRMEGSISGLHPEAVIGKNFFTDIAPCTNTPRFKGVFDAGVKSGQLKTMFEYTYDFQMKPTEVAVRLVRVNMEKSIGGATYWVLVQVR